MILSDLPFVQNKAYPGNILEVIKIFSGKFLKD